MPHFLGKCPEQKCTVESRPDAPVLHGIRVSVWEHPRSLLGLGSAEMVVAVNAEHRVPMLGRRSITNSVPAQRLLCGARLAFHSLHFARALPAKVLHGEFVYEVLCVWRIASRWKLLCLL